METFSGVLQGVLRAPALREAVVAGFVWSGEVVDALAVAGAWGSPGTFAAMNAVMTSSISVPIGRTVLMQLL